MEAENGLKGVRDEEYGCGSVDKNNEEVFFISLKEEPFDEVENFSGGDARAAEQLPKVVRENGPPPFLEKTFEMVDDTETDSIISWSSTRASFVVWDPYKFSTDLLPKHFKHSNFSSFVRQLNTYRFRKIDPDKWEFANEGFQQGKKHLLKHIKRRKQDSSHECPTNRGIEAELKNLKNDHNALTTQVSKLRQQQQQDTLHRLTAIQERLRVIETKQKHMVIFMAKSLKNSMFLIEKMKRRRALSNGVLKKRRLAYDKSCQVEEEMIIESETQACSSDESNSSSYQLKDMSPSETSSLDVCSENFVMWEKLMEDDMIYEKEEAAIEKQSDIVSELENLIANPPNGMVELIG